MRRLQRCLARFLCSGVLIAQLHAPALAGESADENRYQTPPSQRFIDVNRLFQKEPEIVKRISEQLQQLEVKHGYKIYLVLESLLIASTPAELATDLRQAWLPHGEGLVLVFELDSRQLGIGRDLESRLGSDNTHLRIPAHETSGILARAIHSTDARLKPELYIEALIGNLVGEHQDYFQRLTTRPPPERSVKMSLLVIGGLALLCLSVIAIGGLVRHSRTMANQRFQFPVVDRPERLGAPCGTSVTARKFGAPQTKSSSI